MNLIDRIDHAVSKCQILVTLGAVDKQTKRNFFLNVLSFGSFEYVFIGRIEGMFDLLQTLRFFTNVIVF